MVRIGLKKPNRTSAPLNTLAGLEDELRLLLIIHHLTRHFPCCSTCRPSQSLVGRGHRLFPQFLDARFTFLDQMANSRTNIPQVNLKDRIAALQQRNAAPPQSGSESGVSGASSISGRVAGSGGVSSLKDKIANFERKGAVPVPRGRFGESVPAASDAPVKKRGELYGNRVPELAKSTGEAALLVRKRTVSSHTPRSYSISKPLSPTPTGNSPPLPPLQPQRTGDWAGFSEARLPSNFDKVERRIASDALPHTTTFSNIQVEEPLVEIQVEHREVGNQESTEDRPKEDIEEPQIIVESTSTLSEDSAVVLQTELTSNVPVSGPDETSHGTSTDANATVGLHQDDSSVLKASVCADSLASPASAAADDNVRPTLSSSALQGPDDSYVQTVTLPSVPAGGLPSVNVPADDISPPPSAPLSLNTEMSSSSSTEGVSASSEELHTPSDNVSFETAESPKAVDEVSAINVQVPAVVAKALSVSTPAVARKGPTSTTKLTDTLPASDDKRDGTTEGSSDLPDTPQTAKPKPAAIVPPTPSATTPAASPSSPLEKAALEYKTGQKSFHAVVHRKVVETSPIEPAPTNRVTRPAEKKPNPSFPPQKSTVQRVVSQAYVEPDSPSIGDLAALVADAAMLEEVLADPVKKPTRATKAPLPEIRESRSLERPRPTEIRVEGVQVNTIVPPEDSPYSDYKTAANSSSFFTSNLRAAPANPRKSTSPSPSQQSQGSKPFSSLRVRKQNDSTMVSTPPSPPMHSQEGSDTSSIRSSSKSWKSSKKGIGRASSWLFRKREERPLPPLPEPTSPTPSSMLSPNVPVSRRQGEAPLPTRPESWLSVSSAGSGGEAFSNEIFDAFPSVPGSLPVPSHSQTLPLGQRSSHGLTRPHTISGRPSGL